MDIFWGRHTQTHTHDTKTHSKQREIYQKTKQEYIGDEGVHQKNEYICIENNYNKIHFRKLCQNEFEDKSCNHN